MDFLLKSTSNVSHWITRNKSLYTRPPLTSWYLVLDWVIKASRSCGLRSIFSGTPPVVVAPSLSLRFLVLKCCEEKNQRDISTIYGLVHFRNSGFVITFLRGFAVQDVSHEIGGR